jgi:hypothetical protein
MFLAVAFAGIVATNSAIGTADQLLDTDKPGEVICEHGGRTFFSEQYDWHAHAQFETIDDELVVARDARRGRYRLHSIDRTSGMPASQFTTLEVEAVLGCADDAMWVVSSGEPRHVYRLPLAQESVPVEILPIDNRWSLHDVQFDISPSRRYIAIGATHQDRNFFNERALVVFDVVGKKEVFLKDDIHQREFG